MSRPMPADFIGKDTYGVSTSANRDRLPIIPQGTRGDLTQVLVGKKGIPTRVALAGLLVADEVDDIARLVIGAIVDASNVGKTRAALSRPYEADGWSDRFIQWGRINVQAVAVAPPGQDDASNALELPGGAFPQWVLDLEIDAGKLLEAVQVDEMEVAAYAGILAYAIGKQPTADNLKAFNDNRRNAITQFMPTAERRIFVDESPYLSLEVLGKVHRSFNSVIKDRALVMSAVVDADNPLVSGSTRMFYVLFRLGAGASLNPLLIILRFGRKYPEMYGLFPDLETEYHAVAHALQRFYDASETRRMYLKVIFGSSYIPVDRKDIEALLGVAAFTLKQTDTTLENYQGGTISVEHRLRIVRHMNIAHRDEEAVPEGN